MQATGWIRNLSPQVIAVGLLSSVAVIIPGYLTLLVHKPHLVVELDAPRLMLVCSGVTLPMLLTHLQRSETTSAAHRNPIAARAVWVALLRTWAILLTALSISYLWDTRFETHVMITAVIQALVWGATRSPGTTSGNGTSGS